MASHTLTYTINLNGNITKGVLDISGAATKATSTMDKLAGKANKIANIGMAYHYVASAIGKATAAMDKYVNAYNVQMVAERQLEQVMRNTVGATNSEIQSIKDFAAAQQKLGVIGDEVQLAGAKELATYITKTESLKKLLPMMNDMLAHQYGLNASQESAVQIAQMVGKVLDGQMGALSRAGYRFTDAQEAILKFGNEQQRVAELSKIVTQYVGGVNAALAATPEGKWKQHQNNMGDLRERIGGLFVVIRGSLMPAFEATGNLIQRLTAFFEENKVKIMQVAEVVGNILSGAFNVVGNVVMFVVNNFKTLLTVGGLWLSYIVIANFEFIKFSIAYYTKVILMTKVTKVFTAVSNGLKNALNALAKHPWLIAITAAIGLTIALVNVFRKFNKAQREARDAVNNISVKIGMETSNLNKLFEAMKKTNPESERRKTLIDEINSKYPDLLKNQDLYRASIDKITEAQKEANKVLARDIFLKSYGEDYVRVMKEINDAKKKFMDKVVSEGINPAHKAVGNAADMANTMAEKAINDKVKSISGWSFNPYHRPGYFHDVAMGKSDKETRMVLSKVGGAWEDMFLKIFEKQKTIKALGDYGMGLFGLTQEQLMSSVNGGGVLPGGNGSGETNPLATTTEAIATGGTRNTTVNIHLGKMQAAEHIHYSGGMKENANDMKRVFAENIYEVLGIAEKST
jgi:hypothetical protein